MDYRPRVVEAQVLDLLRLFPGVQIQGVKGCGKTRTGEYLSQSRSYLDLPGVDRTLALNSPARLLVGPWPRLLDEWGTVPTLWNHVRHAADHPAPGDPPAGRFITTASATRPVEGGEHTMFDRIAAVTMRPMSLFEAGASTGEVSVGDLVLSPRQAATGIGTGADLVDIVELLCIGGWPRTLGMSVSDARAMNRQRVDAIAATEVPSLGNRSDPARVARMLRSLARNIATYTPLTTLADDTAMAGGEQPIDPGTARRYLDALRRLMAVEELPAWQPHLRSKAQMRSGSKLFLVDPALACAALDAGPETLLRDPNYLGFLFEAMVIRDLRVYSPPGCTLSQYRDNKGHEVDAICQAGDGRWAAFEVKLGRTDPDPAKDPIERAAASLRHFVDTMIDPDRVPAPSSLNVIVAAGAAYQRDDGVNVIPLTSLGP